LNEQEFWQNVKKVFDKYFLKSQNKHIKELRILIKKNEDISFIKKVNTLISKGDGERSGIIQKLENFHFEVITLLLPKMEEDNSSLVNIDNPLSLVEKPTLTEAELQIVENLTIETVEGHSYVHVSKVLGQIKDFETHIRVMKFLCYTHLEAGKPMIFVETAFKDKWHTQVFRYDNSGEILSIMKDYLYLGLKYFVKNLDGTSLRRLFRQDLNDGFCDASRNLFDLSTRVISGYLFDWEDSTWSESVQVANLSQWFTWNLIDGKKFEDILTILDNLNIAKRLINPLVVKGIENSIKNLPNKISIYNLTSLQVKLIENELIALKNYFIDLLKMSEKELILMRIQRFKQTKEVELKEVKKIDAEIDKLYQQLQSL